MSDKPNVYECPSRSQLSLPYMLAVMQAATSGAPVQYARNPRGAAKDRDWVLLSEVSWSWGQELYRIDPASAPGAAHPAEPAFKVGDYVIALKNCDANDIINLGHVYQVEEATHSPHWGHMLKLKGQMGPWAVKTHLGVFFQAATPAQISLATWADADARGFVTHAKVQAPYGIDVIISRSYIEPKDGKPAFISAFLSNSTFNGEFPISDLKLAPAPKMKKVPMVSSDYPAIFWIRPPVTKSSPIPPSWMPECVYETGIKMDGELFTFHELTNRRFEFSSDRKVWHPCWKEVEDKS